MNYFQHRKSFGTEFDRCLEKIKEEVFAAYKLKNQTNAIDDQSKPVRLHASTIDGKTAYAAFEAILKDNITMGDNVNEYEKKYSGYLGRQFTALSCNSGSSANLLLIATLVHCGVLRKGDKVVVPSLCWSTTVFPLVQYGLIPIFCDADANDFNIDISIFEEICRIEKPKALFLIHTYGCAADMDAITAICNQYNVILLEDTCESMGAEWNAQKVGTFGLASSFSTYYSHHICTLEGGFAAFSDAEHALWAKSIRSHGWVRDFPRTHPIIQDHPEIDSSFLFASLGYNLRLSEPQAAMGIEQLEQLDTFIIERRRTADRLTKAVSNYDDCFSWLQPKTGAYSSWFGFPIVLKGPFLNKRDQFRSFLKAKGIESRPFLVGDFTKQPIAQGLGVSSYSSKTVSSIMESGLAIPCHQSLDESEVERMISAIALFVKENI